ncbi:MAG TPA: heme lyase NrfEFG subunit NrfE, partial [Colwellia sp.]|nr:heme lyase NrfEFG subunit NrfE [Colwellia sp.]
PPYFNAVFVPIMSILFIIMGIGPLIRWKKAKQGELRKRLLSSSVFSIAFGLLFPVVYGGEFNILVAMGITLATWVFLVVVKEIKNHFQTVGKLTTSHIGMATAHAGIAITIVGVTIVSMYESETNVKMALNERVTVSGYEIEFKGIKHVEGPNYSAEQGQINIYKVNGSGESDFVSLLKPERRTYRVQTMGMTEAGIDPGLFRDVYVALGDPLPDGAWAIRVHYKPFVRWIWLGAIFMA